MGAPGKLKGRFPYRGKHLTEDKTAKPNILQYKPLFQKAAFLEGRQTSQSPEVFPLKLLHRATLTIADL